MQDTPEVRTVKRVPLSVLLQQARSFTEADSDVPAKGVSNRSWETGKRFRTCSVHEFYEPFLQMSGADEEEARAVQKWIADSIEVTLGVADTPVMTMEELASRISVELSKEDLADEDRWALYELCFMLTAQMCALREEFFSRKEQSIRWGTPDEQEPRSLFRRVNALRRARKATQAEAAPVKRVSLDELLRIARGSGCRLSEKTRKTLPRLNVGPVLHCLMTTKYNLDEERPADRFALMNNTCSFEVLFRTNTGEDWDDDSTISEIAAVMTWKFKLEAESHSISRERMLQAYELCYEFINVLAYEGCDEGHVTLMDRECQKGQSSADEKGETHNG